MEANLLVTTTNINLKKQMHEEVQRIRQHTVSVNSTTFESEDRNVGRGVRLAAWTIRDML